MGNGDTCGSGESSDPMAQLSGQIEKAIGGADVTRKGSIYINRRDPSTFSEGDWRHCYVGLEMFGRSKYLLRRYLDPYRETKVL